MAMDIVPLIRLKKRKMIKENDEILSLDKLKNLVKKDVPVYLYDIDGIEKDKPNLCLYQKISQFQKIWIDAGPRVLGDVVDAIMAGATSITLRKDIWKDIHVPSIKEITESDIFLEVGTTTNEIYDLNPSLFNELDGFVLFANKLNLDRDFKLKSYLKNLFKNYKIYVYESDPKNLSNWKNLGVSGILMDIDKAVEVQQY